ncbi:MAG TPA: PRC-barrel domain-containing protein, partial [Longimicrobiales bacterium]
EREILAAHSRLFSGEKYYAHPAFDHAGQYAGEHALSSVPASPAGADLVRLSRLPSHEVAEEEQDVRGWPVLARDGVAGEVEDLVADPAALRVRYALVRLTDEPAESHVLLPVGFLDLDGEAGRVCVPALQAADVRALPRQKGPIRRADEDELRAALDRVLDGRRRFERPDFRAGVV